MPRCNTDQQNRLVVAARRLLATYEDMAEMIRIGAYRAGSDQAVDEAIRYQPALDAFLAQEMTEFVNLDQGYTQLSEILGVEAEASEALPAPDAAA